MVQPCSSKWLAPFDSPLKLSSYPTRVPNESKDSSALKSELRRVVKKIAKLQRKLYADDRSALLCVFQAMDAAGKDSTIRAVFSGVNPAGFQVHSFKKPSEHEIDHDFLWRTAKALPERGRIGVFNRSYYEEVLVVRVHEDILEHQRLPPGRSEGDVFWQERLQSIADHELHLARNGTRVLKFFLNVSKEEQAARFISRIDEPHKNWKFNPGDIKERQLWQQYQQAYTQALQSTSKPWAPWYVVPADDKPRMRLEVAKIILAQLEQMPLEWPALDDANLAQLQSYRDGLTGGSL
ncbi:MAG: PPK2 family polyphosphate kinase [Granulosicoccaceae bacterium]